MGEAVGIIGVSLSAAYSSSSVPTYSFIISIDSCPDDFDDHDRAIFLTWFIDEFIGLNNTSCSRLDDECYSSVLTTLRIKQPHLLPSAPFVFERSFSCVMSFSIDPHRVYSKGSLSFADLLKKYQNDV